MGKSIRSKVKRHFRAKKREEGVFAASEAARLQRLSSKLAAVRDAPAPKAELLEGDNEEEGTEGREGQVPGLSWFLLLGLLEHGSFTSANLRELADVCGARLH